jgi:hypothetical protein
MPTYAMSINRDFLYTHAWIWVQTWTFRLTHILSSLSSIIINVVRLVWITYEIFLIKTARLLGYRARPRAPEYFLVEYFRRYLDGKF